MRGAGRVLIAVAASLHLVGGLALFAYQQVRLASGVVVLGQVVRTDCSDRTLACRPIVQFRTLEGTQHTMWGAEGPGATGFEAGDEWREVLYWPGDPASARDPATFGLLYPVAYFLVGLGLILLTLVWTEPGEAAGAPAGQPPWRARVVAAFAGVIATVTAFAMVARHDWTNDVALGVVAFGCAVVAGVRMGRHPGAMPWGASCWVVASLGAALVVGLVALPVRLHPDLLACAPLAVAITLPLQLRRWPLAEQAVAESRARARRLQEIRGALVPGEGTGAIVVRVAEVEESGVDAVRRTTEGEAPLRALRAVFRAASPMPGWWYLVSGPVTDQLPSPSGGGYREAATVLGLVDARRIEPLGQDLDRLLAGGPPTPRPLTLLAPPVAVLLVVSLLGAWALHDRQPARSGPPIPREGLFEKLDRPRTYAASVVSSEQWPPLVEGTACTVRIEPSSGNRNCWIGVECIGEPVYGVDKAGYTKCLTSAAGALVAEDTSATEGDPAIRLDSRTRRVVVRKEHPDRSVTIELAVP